MSDPTFDAVVVGAGIVGLATARELLRRGLAKTLAVLEKEPDVAGHQTGHNSGVIHSGAYYRPGSLKARLCLEGRELLLAFCDEHRIPYRVDGKVIVATREEELSTLEQIASRGHENGVSGLARISEAEISRYEPHVRGIDAVWVPTAGVVDFRVVARAIAADIASAGGRILPNRGVTAMHRTAGAVRLETSGGPIAAGRVIVCGGLQCDRLAADLVQARGARIVPFRGDYYRLTGRAEGLIRALVYPVPDARFPFLGVHFARHIGGEVTAGPNAVLAFSREGYGRWSVDARDLFSTLGFPGFWRMAGRHWRKGAAELWRDYVRRAYWRQLRRMVPELRLDDLRRGPCGIRAQSVMRDGALLEDFWILQAGPVTHVLNAPSPAATSSLAIAREVVGRAASGSDPS